MTQLVSILTWYVGSGMVVSCGRGTLLFDYISFISRFLICYLLSWVGIKLRTRVVVVLIIVFMPKNIDNLKLNL